MKVFLNRFYIEFNNLDRLTNEGDIAYDKRNCVEYV